MGDMDASNFSISVSPVTGKPLLVNARPLMRVQLVAIRRHVLDMGLFFHHQKWIAAIRTDSPPKTLV
jgi:hypothetical protein